MRMMFRAEWPVERGNEVIKSGRMGELVGAILEEQKPESVYFVASNGKRCAVFVIDMQDMSELAKIAEPWFLAFNASIEAVPAMVPEDLMKAEADIVEAVAKYGRG